MSTALCAPRDRPLRVVACTMRRGGAGTLDAVRPQVHRARRIL
jgi:hypothetical protein